MTYAPSKDDAPTDLEARMGIPSLSALHAERRDILKQLIPLKLLYGSGGDRADAKRKQHRNVIEKLLRQELPDGKDTAQNRMESMANSDPRHVAFCDDLDDKYIKYEHWSNCLNEIDELIAAREYESRYITKELGLQHSGLDA